MASYQSVLVAVDFTTHSEKALLKGIELAKQFDAKLNVVHVMELPTYPILEDIAVLGLPGVLDTELTEQITAKSKQRLDTLLLQSGLELSQAKLLIGSASTEILNYAQLIRADLIVMGSHGVRGLTHLLGSTVDSVLHQAVCDVLAINLEKSQGKARY